MSSSQMSIEDLIEVARVAGGEVAAEAIGDGHPETAQTCWEMWNDTGVGPEVDAALDSLLPLEMERVKAAFVASADEVNAGRCPWTSAGECAMARERSVAGVSNEIPACPEHAEVN